MVVEEEKWNNNSDEGEANNTYYLGTTSNGVGHEPLRQFSALCGRLRSRCLPPFQSQEGRPRLPPNYGAEVIK